MKKIEREAIESIWTNWIQEYGHDETGCGYVGSILADYMGSKAEYMTREQYIESFRKAMHKRADNMADGVNEAIDTYIHDMEL